MRTTVNIQKRLAQYAPIRLQADVSRLSDDERAMIPLLIEAAQAMDDPFWIQNYGEREALLAATADAGMRRYLQLNYGPWDRLHGNAPFLEGVGAKPPGANFYPPDMTREEFDASAASRPELKSPYTMVRRDGRGNLVSIPYHDFFREHVHRAADGLRQAAALAEEPDFKTYLALRADALLSDDYRPSDIAWVDMKANIIDILIGPMEVEDRLLGIKTAYAASVLVKDRHGSEQLAHYAGLLSRFQETLPVPDAYKQEQPGLDSQLGVFDMIYCAGNDKAAPPIGICWPADIEVQLRQGTRSLLLKNVMRARFEKNLLPLADLLLAADQRPYVTFKAYFNYVMLHELAHGLGIRQTIGNKGSAKDALKEQHHVIEEGKAEVLSLFMMSRLYRWGHVSRNDLRDVCVTSLVKHLWHYGPQSVVWLNFGRERGAYTRNANTGTYRVNLEQMLTAAGNLAGQLLRFQGDGDYAGVQAFVERYTRPGGDLERDNERIEGANLPLGLVVEQEYA